MKKALIRTSYIIIILVFGFLSSTMAQKTIEKSTTPANLSYFTVREKIGKYVGRQVQWVGQETSRLSSSSGDNAITRTLVFIARDADGKFFADNPFSFSWTGGWEDLDTPASKTKNRLGPRVRLITGTITGSTKFKDSHGNISLCGILGRYVASLEMLRV